MGSSKSKHAHVKKTDSSMQTETSAFHHVSSSSWKKYLLQQQQQQDAQSVKSDKGSSSNSKKSLKGSDSKKGSDSHRSKHKLSVVPDIEKCQQQQQQPKGGSSSKGSCESLEPGRSKGSSSSSRSVAPATGAPPYGGKQRAGGPGSSSNGYKQGGRASQNGGGRQQRGEGSDADEVSQCCGEQRRPAASERSSGKGASKVKVCGSTQTGDPYSSPAVHSDGEYSSLGRKYPPPRQYFMTTPGPGTGLKERVYGSRSALNGSPTPLSEYAGVSRAPRLSAPLRDMDNYATLDHGPYSTWMRHSPSCGTSVRGGTLTEADSMESLSSTSSSIHAQVSTTLARSLYFILITKVVLTSVHVSHLTRIIDSPLLKDLNDAPCVCVCVHTYMYAYH